MRHLKITNNRGEMPLELFMGMPLSDYVGQEMVLMVTNLHRELHLRFITFSLQPFQLLELKEWQIFHQIALTLSAE